jgi:hypothetical protein
VPLLHVAAERFALELEADALAAPRGRAEDVSLKGVIRLSQACASGSDPDLSIYAQNRFNYGTRRRRHP